MWPRAVATVALRAPGPLLLAASGAGWIALGWLLSADGPPHIVTTGQHEHGLVSGAALTPPLSGHFIAMWLAMVMAMAPPLLIREIRRLWRGSLHRSRHLAVLVFLSGYLAIWLGAGVVLGTLAGWLAVSLERLVVAVAIAAVWHCSPARQRCLNACHRVPALRAFGVPARWDALRYGASTGWNCAGACGAAMLLALLAADAHLVAMAVVTIIATAERYLPATRPCWRLPFTRGRSAEWFLIPNS